MISTITALSLFLACIIGVLATTYVWASLRLAQVETQNRNRPYFGDKNE